MRIRSLAALVLTPFVGRATAQNAPSRVELEVARGVSERTARLGAPPILRVASPVIVAGETVIAAGAPAFATVLESRGSVRIRVDNITTSRGIVRSFTVFDTRDATRTSTPPRSSDATALAVAPTFLARCLHVVAELTPSSQRARASATTSPSLASPASAEPPCGERELWERIEATRSARTAALRSLLFPGAGHHFAQADVRSVLFGAGAGISLLISASTIPSGDVRMLRNGLASYGALMIVSALDAPRAARQRNERALLGRIPKDSHRPRSRWFGGPTW